MNHPAVIPLIQFTKNNQRLGQIKDDTNFCRQDSERFPISYCITPATHGSNNNIKEHVP